jgi:mono/diheme cytochrome c family protein
MSVGGDDGSVIASLLTMQNEDYLLMTKTIQITLGIMTTVIIALLALLLYTFFTPTEAASSPTFFPAERAAPSTYSPSNGTVSENDPISRAGVLYAQNCSGCHGPTGQGSAIAPPLNSAELRARLDNAALTATISKGRPNTQMPAWGDVLSRADIAALVTLIRRWDDLSETEVPQMGEQAPQQGPGWMGQGPSMMNGRGGMGHGGGMGGGMMGRQGGGMMGGGRP